MMEFMQKENGQIFDEVTELEKAWDHVNAGKMVFFSTYDHIATGVPTSEMKEMNINGKIYRFGKVVQAGASIGTMYIDKVWGKRIAEVKIFVSKTNGDAASGDVQNPVDNTSNNSNSTKTTDNSNNNQETIETVSTISASVGKGGINKKADVILVQKALNKAISVSLSDDGVCGPLTINAIIKFQKQQFNRADGRIDVGGATASKLFKNTSNAENDSTPTKIIYEKTEEIKDNILNSFFGKEEIKIGHQTEGNIKIEEAQKLFDKSLSLPNQNVGKNAPNAEEDIMLIQKLLGLKKTGKYDSKLEQAILDFQTFIGLNADGVIGKGGKSVIALISYQKALSESPEISKEKGVKIQHPQPGAKFFSPFGMRKGFMVNGKYLADHLHPGIDCGTGFNTPVYAVSDGIVILSGVNGGFGNCIKIDHGKDESGKQFITVYGHLNSCSVLNGTKVTKGMLIGKEGSTGLSTATHLHFEVRINNTTVDPMPYINGAKLFPKQA